MKKSGKWQLLAAAAMALLIGGLLIFVYRPADEPPQTPPPQAAENRTLREVVLYFGSPDGAYLVPETRQVEDCPDEIDCLQRVVQELAAGPAGDLVRLLPEQTRLRQATVENGTATLDLSRDLIDGHPGGSLTELLTVYALADTLAVNFPHIRQTRILIEGQAVETLKGHLGLQEPIKADFRYARPPEGIGDVGPAGERRTP